MSEFDAGHSYMDEDEKEFNRIMNLTEDEKKVFAEIKETMNKVSSEFTFAMRELQAHPDRMLELKMHFRMKGETLKMFTWLQYFCVKGGWTTHSILAWRIIEAGVACIYGEEQQKEAANFLEAQMLLKNAPEEIFRARCVQNVRAMLKTRQEIEDKKLNESLGKEVT